MNARNMMKRHHVIGPMGGKTWRPLHTVEERNSISLVSFLFLIILLISCWYFASSKNAVAIQQLVETGELNRYKTEMSKPFTMAFLTSLQILLGLFISLPLYAMSLLRFHVDNSKSNHDEDELSSCAISVRVNRPRIDGIEVSTIIVGSIHYIGSLLTNLGFMYGSALLVQVVKLLEPVETLFFAAFINVCFFNKDHGITPRKLFGTILIVQGALMLLLQKGIKTEENMASVGFIVLSGLIMSTRNVVQKSICQSKKTKAGHTHWQQYLSNGLENYIKMSLVATIPSLMVVLIAPNSQNMINSVWNTMGVHGKEAVLYHGLYNIASIALLSITTAQTHALLNVGKRIANVLVATVFFDIQIKTGGLVGICVAALGGLVYFECCCSTSKPPSLEKKKSKTKTGLIVFLLGSVAIQSSLLIGILRKFPTLREERLERRHIVLLGPHERFNFGDLLFEKVVSKLLMTELGYRDDEIVRAATVSRSMRKHGGPDRIYSMKEVQNMSRTSPYGPFDIIYTGGQAMGCSYDWALKYLPEEYRKIAENEKIYECAYLFPKELLLPLDNRDRPDTSTKNIAISNSIGGYPGISECNRAAETADYTVYRDIEPLVPDSAVMVKELYGDIISSEVEDLRKTIFIDEDPNQKYIAVQHHMHFDQIDSLPHILDEIAWKTNCTIVFFAAGTAPNHDSFELYKTIASEMVEDAIVYRGEHVWSTVAMIAGAEAVLSTSLHVRIMSFVYHKPRVAWCTEEKHEKFINLWDAPDMRICSDVESTWDTLSLYWGQYPEITQDMTKAYYAKTTKKYMQSFHTWAALLDESNKVIKYSY